MSEETIDDIQTIVNDNDIPIMYAVNLKNDKGFIIMSASLVEAPILAYNDKGSFRFDNLGDYAGVAEWAYARYLKINGLIELGSVNESVIKQWQTLSPNIGIPFKDVNGNPWISAPVVNQSTQTETHGPLMTTTWNQSSGDNTYLVYNNRVRFKNCSAGTSPTGCVATATGQIMKYHNWPNIYSTQTMPTTVDGSNATTTEADNIAKFMEYIGPKVGMVYSCTASGSNGARGVLVYNNNYTASTLSWLNENNLNQNVLDNKPVYMQGCRRGTLKTTPKNVGVFGWTYGKTTYELSCHAWVGDGFEKHTYVTQLATGQVYTSEGDEYYHLNWGWGGARNGWYLYEVWDEVNGVNIPTVDFFYEQKALYNITPN